MREVVMIFIVMAVVYLFIMQCAANTKLCFTEEEWQQIKAAVNRYKSAIKRFINNIFKRIR